MISSFGVFGRGQTHQLHALKTCHRHVFFTPLSNPTAKETEGIPDGDPLCFCVRTIKKIFSVFAYEFELSQLNSVAVWQRFHIVLHPFPIGHISFGRIRTCSINKGRTIFVISNRQFYHRFFHGGFNCPFPAI